MATGTKALGRDRWFVFPTDWAGYRALDRARGERSVPRITYLDGRATLVSPGYSHESLKKRLGWIIETALMVLRIRFVAAGQTTYRRKSRRGGVEGDESYYLANAPRVAGKKRIDLRTDPPPDLAVEVVITHPVKDALEVYRRLGVPEVWVCDGRSLRFLILQPNRRYADAPVSPSLPALTPATVLDWLTRPETGDEGAWRADVLRWAQEELAPPEPGGPV